MNTPLTDIDKGPRIPVQDRSKVRVQKILDATESIIVENGWGAASSHAIAKKAGVPPAGVYHFFPDRYMIYDALVDRYNEQFNVQLSESLEATNFSDWQNIVDFVVDAISAFARENPCSRNLSYGCNGEFATRWSNLTHSDDVAVLLKSLFVKRLQVSDDAASDMQYLLAAEIIQTGFTHAVRAGDPLDEKVVEETRTAAKAYIGTWM